MHGASYVMEVIVSVLIDRRIRNSGIRRKCGTSYGMIRGI